jgi:hypothetical protein
MARRASAGVESSTWFSRHGSIPICEIPDHWPNDYKEVIEKRLSLLEIDSEIGQLERPEFKRRWNSPKWEDLEEKTLRNWLLTRLETHALWSTSSDRPPQIITAARLAEAVQRDADFMQVAARFAGHADFDLARTIADLVAVESVPFLPVMCYSDTGLRKREQWENTWALQRREDEIDADVVTTEGPGWRAELTADARTRFGLPESGSAEVSEQGLPEDRSLAVAWWPGRTQGALGQLPRLRTRRRWQPAHRLGRLGPSAASHRTGRLLPRNEGKRRLGSSTPATPAGGPAGTGALAGAMAQRGGPGLRRAHGRVLQGLRVRGSALAWLHAGRLAGLEAGCGPVRRGRRRAT